MADWRSPEYRSRIKMSLAEHFYPSDHAKSLADLESTIFANSTSHENYIQNAMQTIRMFKEKEKLAIGQQQTMQTGVTTEEIKLTVVEDLEDWKRPDYRSRIRMSLDEHFCPSDHVKSVTDLENTIFANSTSHEDYIQNTIKTIKMLKEKYRANMAQHTITQDLKPNLNDTKTDPMSALQTLVNFSGSENQTTTTKSNMMDMLEIASAECNSR